MGQIWPIMTQNDWLWPRMTYQGSWGHQGVQGGARGHQGAPGGSRLPPAPKRVIKQQNNGPKPWFKVPKVCPDPKGMVYTHFWGIWSHLDGLQQRYLVKMAKVVNLGFGNFFSPTNTQSKWCKKIRFWNFPYPLTWLGGMENCQKLKSFIKIWLCIGGNFTLNFWPGKISFF